MFCCIWSSSGLWFQSSIQSPNLTFITNNNNKKKKSISISDKPTRELQIKRSSSYSPPVANFSTKSSSTMDSVPKNQEPIFEFLTKKPYVPPSWASRLNPVPSHVFSLGHFPTPIHKWHLPNLPKDTEVYLKRDDLSGMQLSGNKVRKLEFLLADAVAQGTDCIITIGGIQSNHCRATAVAAKYLNLDCYLILRTSKVLVENDPGLIGNLLVERLVGAHIDLVSKEEYANVGSEALTNILKEKLIYERRKPYVIPVGGSNSLGTWGYIEAIREIKEQQQKGSGAIAFDDIVVACGSGGTIAGLSVGSWLSDLGAKVHAYCVCDDPEYFYQYTQGLLDGLDARVSSRDIVTIRNNLTASRQLSASGKVLVVSEICGDLTVIEHISKGAAKGLGYAINTAEELKFVKEIAEVTGVILDPVYSGKAAYGMIKDMTENPEKWQGKKVLFIHTGGLLGLFDKMEQMGSLVGNWRRMDIHEPIPRKEGTGKMF